MTIGTSDGEQHESQFDSVFGALEKSAVSVSIDTEGRLKTDIKPIISAEEAIRIPLEGSRMPTGAIKGSDPILPSGAFQPARLGTEVPNPGPQSMSDEQPDEIKAGQQYASMLPPDPLNQYNKPIIASPGSPPKIVTGVTRLPSSANDNKTFDERFDIRAQRYEELRDRLLGPKSQTIPKDVVDASRKLGHLGFDRAGDAVGAVRQDFKEGGATLAKKRWDVGSEDELTFQRILDYIKKNPFPK